MSKEFSQEEFVTVFTSYRHNAEMEVQSIHGLLESAGLESLIVRENIQILPVGKVSVKVLASNAEDAKQLICKAQQGTDQGTGEEDDTTLT